MHAVPAEDMAAATAIPSSTGSPSARPAHACMTRASLLMMPASAPSDTKNQRRPPPFLPPGNTATVSESSLLPASIPGSVAPSPLSKSLAVASSTKASSTLHTKPAPSRLAPAVARAADAACSTSKWSASMRAHDFGSTVPPATTVNISIHSCTSPCESASCSRSRVLPI